MLDAAREDRLETVFLAIEHTRRPGHPRRLDAGDLRDTSLGREVAPEDGEMPVRVERALPRADDFLIGPRRVRHVVQHLGNLLPGDRQGVAVQHAVRQQDLHDLGDPARAMEIDGDEASRGLQVAQHRDARADRLEVVERERHAGGVRDGEQVEHSVGRAPDRHGHCDRVLERLAREDLARAEVSGNRFH